jgi:hypothetical protein
MKRWSTSKGAKIRIKMPQRAIKCHEEIENPMKFHLFDIKGIPKP